MYQIRMSFFMLLLSSFLLVGLSSCGGKRKAKTGETAVTTESGKVEGEALNQFFPEGMGSYKVVYNQEKDGFVQASLKENGTEVATLAVSDMKTNQKTKDKFKASSEMVGSYPALKKGSKGTAILVGDRYQVQVRSKADSFGEAERKAWLQKFDLAGLAKLQ